VIVVMELLASGRHEGQVATLETFSASAFFRLRHKSRRPERGVEVEMGIAPFLFLVAVSVSWEHPGGMVTEESLSEIRVKLEEEAWAQDLWKNKRERLKPWLEASPERLKEVFPEKRGNVYHNFSCPHDRTRLIFDPFQETSFQCPTCSRVYAPETDPEVYEKDDRYHGTMADGWACLFFLTSSDAAMDLGLYWRIEAKEAYRERAIDLLMLYADTIEGLPTDVHEDPQRSRILTYHREGDNKILNDLGIAYELVREGMTEGERDRFEGAVLRRMLNDLMLEPIYTYDHNNVYQWHRTILQTAVALEREDLIDWCFGKGEMSPEKKPEHRSIQRILETHFLPCGAYWEMCSGYHLYPLSAFCELAVFSHHLSCMDPVRFPVKDFDMTDPTSQGYGVLKRALEWFPAMAMPDRTMPTQGDSPQPRAGMDDYHVTAEVGYRYFDVKAVGDYPRLREGKRSWTALLYGANEIVKHKLPFQSSYLSSGWVSLRNEWEGNRAWVGLNALVAGGGHQHADRLNLLLYSQGELLALEKGTPYNESVTRVLGTLSCSHNTVTVDFQSMKQGEKLTEEETPRIVYFHDSDAVKFAEAHGDALYPGVDVFRRSVALVEDVVVDLFRVEGGEVHDWMLHHAGPSPRVSLDLRKTTFEPEDWLYHGGAPPQAADTDEDWSAQWRVQGVTSRLQMKGEKDTRVFSLETYPIDNAMVASGHPPCQSVCVRRKNDKPFFAVWDAWKEKPQLKSLEWQDAHDAPPAVKLITKSHVYTLMFGPGEQCFSEDIRMKTDAAFACLRDEDHVSWVDGTFLRVEKGGRAWHVVSSEKVSLTWTRIGAEADKTGQFTKSGPIQYQTVAGEPVDLLFPDCKIEIREAL